MAIETTPRKKPGRRSTVAAHPERAAIELACARGEALERIGERYGVSRMALFRHWQGVPPERRAYLDEVAAELDAYEARVRGYFADLATRPVPITAADRRRAAQACSRATAEILARICPPGAVAA